MSAGSGAQIRRSAVSFKAARIASECAESGGAAPRSSAVRVLISATSASSAPQELEASISVRRSNERQAFACSIVVTKVATLSARNDA